MARKKTKKAKKLWAMVDDGNMMGDSEFGLHSIVEYKEGMTLKEIRTAFAKTEICADFETDVNTIKVAWIITDKMLKSLENSSVMLYNDSAVYAAAAQMKAFVAEMCEKTIKK